MTREERCKLAIEKGYIYNPETGLVYNRLNKIVKSKDKSGYIKMVIRICKDKIINLYIHHFAWYSVYGDCKIEQIDHINRIKDDNRICNLRSVTRNQNMWNRNNIKGYYFNKNDKKYQSHIKVNGETKYIGQFNTETEAHKAYLEAKEKYHII